MTSVLHLCKTVGTRSAQLVGVNRSLSAAAPLLAIVVALLGSFGHLGASGSAAETFERVLAKSNRASPPGGRRRVRRQGRLARGGVLIHSGPWFVGGGRLRGRLLVRSQQDPAA